MRSRSTDVFYVVDQETGQRRRVTQYEVPSNIRLIGGDVAPMDTEFQLEDGTHLEVIEGNQQFVDGRGRVFRRA